MILLVQIYPFVEKMLILFWFTMNVKTYVRRMISQKVFLKVRIVQKPESENILLQRLIKVIQDLTWDDLKSYILRKYLHLPRVNLKNFF